MKILALLGLLVCGCQAPAVDAEDWTNFYEHQPTSILVLPVLNETSAAEAPIAFSSTITHPLVERGYYVFPVQPTLAILEANGIFEGGQLETVEPQKIHEILGADALLYVTLRTWETRYMVIDSSVEVALQFQLVDARTGEVIWEKSRRQVAGTATGGSNDPFALIEALVGSVINAATTEYVPLAREANEAALSALPPGPLRKDHASVRDQLLARSKSASPRLGP